jgi:hypothetical protein
LARRAPIAGGAHPTGLGVEHLGEGFVVLVDGDGFAVVFAVEECDVLDEDGLPCDPEHCEDFYDETYTSTLH